MSNSNHLSLRQADINDCSLINQMATVVFPLTYQEILTPEQTAYMMEWMYAPTNIAKQMIEESQTYFIAYCDGAPCGYLSVQPEERDLYHLQKIYVMPDFQGKGIGKYLFEQALNYIRSVHTGPCKMHLNVNRHNKAKDFYERMGMHVHSQGDFDIGNGYYMNDFIMEIDL